MREFYDSGLLQRSRALYDAIRAWAEPRGDVTLIGGWAVYELVDESHRLQSRDVDLIVRDHAALMALHHQLPAWGLVWREHGRNRFNDCHLRDDPTKTIVVDVFKDHDFEERIFRGIEGRRSAVVKPAGGHGFLPSLAYMVEDKVRTIPQRRRDRVGKQAKDLLDLHALVFFNREGRDPRELLAVVARAARLQAAAVVPEAMTHRPQNQEALREVEDWLRAEEEPG